MLYVWNVWNSCILTIDSINSRQELEQSMSELLMF